LGFFVLIIYGVGENLVNSLWIPHGVRSNAYCEGMKIFLKVPEYKSGKFQPKFNNLEQMVNALFHRIDSLELERQWTNALEQTVAMLLQRMDSMEQECNQSRAREEERQWINELEQTVARLLRRMDSLEHECNQLRAMAMPQQSNSDQTIKSQESLELEHSREEQEGWEAEPMETEDNAPSQVEIQEEPENESTS
jgi:hypothetical protein